MISNPRSVGVEKPQGLDSSDRSSRIRQRKATGGGGLLRPRPSSSVESQIPTGEALAARMKGVGHRRAVATTDWLNTKGLLSDTDKQALAHLHPEDLAKLLKVSRFSLSDGVSKEADRNNIRRAVLLCAARTGVDAAAQLKKDLLGAYTTGKARGFQLLDESDGASFDPHELRRGLDTLVVDDAVSRKLQQSGHNRAQETYHWVSDSGLVDSADKAQLYKIVPQDINQLMTVSKTKDRVGSLDDRQNIRRAVMLCAAKDGLRAAQDLKRRLLDRSEIQGVGVRGFSNLSADDVQSFAPDQLRQGLEHLERGELTHGAVKVIWQRTLLDRTRDVSQWERQTIDDMASAVDRRLDPKLPPWRRLGALQDLVQRASGQEFRQSPVGDIISHQLFGGQVSARNLLDATARGLQGKSSELHPDLRGALGLESRGPAHGGRVEHTGNLLEVVAGVPRRSGLSADMTPHLADSRKRFGWSEGFKRLQSHARQLPDGAFVRKMAPFRERLQVATTNPELPPPLPENRDRQVRFDPQVMGKTYSPSDAPLAVKVEPEQDMTKRQLAALRGTYMTLLLADEASKGSAPSLDGVIANTLAKAADIERLPVDQLQERIKALQ